MEPDPAIAGAGGGSELMIHPDMCRWLGEIGSVATCKALLASSLVR
jgi:hypothetical protein